MNRFFIHSFITGIILIVLGVLTFRYPVEAIMSAGLFIGIGLVVSGINYFSGYYFFRFRRLIILGLIDIITGIIMITRPGITAFIIPYIIALWLFTTGITRICASFWLGGAEVQGWWLMLMNGIVLIMLALLACASPLTVSLSVMMVIAGALVASGVLAVIEGFMMFR